MDSFPTRAWSFSSYLAPKMEPGKIVSVFAYQPATEVTSNRVMFETYPQQHAKKQYSFALGEQNSSHLWRDDPI